MGDSRKNDQEPEQGGEVVESHVSKPSRLRFADNLRRTLTEAELSDPGARRFLLNWLDRLDQEIEELKAYREKYQEAEKERFALEKALAASRTWDKLFDVCIAMGGVLIGLTPGLWGTPPFGYFVTLAGVVLVGSGVIFKYKIR